MAAIIVYGREVYTGTIRIEDGATLDVQLVATLADRVKAWELAESISEKTGLPIQ